MGDSIKGFIGGFVALGTGVIFASIVYQTVKKDSQGPKVVETLTSLPIAISSDLFKG